jgi:hypothetical protein
MRSFSADDAFDSRNPSPIRPALTNFAHNCATVSRLFAYVGVLALFGILGFQAWGELQVDGWAEEPSVRQEASPGEPVRLLSRGETIRIS